MEKNITFDWERLGNLEKGRQTLGPEMPVAVYRLLQYTIKDEIAGRTSVAEAEDILRGAGYRAGQALARNMLDLTLEAEAFVAHLKTTLLELKIGILNIEKIDLGALEFTLTVDEDLDCSGLPVTGDTVCFYDEGFIAGIFTLYLKRPMRAVEISCWGTGATTCRFDITPK
ncbi:V4R domain-containing protein [Breznakiella homolactica]|uniref:4-vinyl reductase n=1 Tax=Breznakiella homolactica TaxID=2798577 RepID=A0A7T7XJK5_9SPIR|nr:V4R domain-containing protein [Breznakiella homolactica]QQO07605.1 4-vinyl reductase [Breznakiella homolactica]